MNIKRVGEGLCEEVLPIFVPKRVIILREYCGNVIETYKIDYFESQKHTKSGSNIPNCGKSIYSKGINSNTEYIGLLVQPIQQ